MDREIRESVGKRIGQNIKVARARADNMTQEQLAQRLGTHQETVSRWERGDIVPSIAQIYRMAEVFQIDPAWLAMRGSMEAGKIAEDLRAHKAGLVEAILEQIKMLPPDERRELARKLISELLG